MSCLSACSGIDDTVKDSAETVLTLRSGTMSDLRKRVGQGPFRTYEIPPAEMLEILEEAVGEARGRGDRPIRAVFVSELLCDLNHSGGAFLPIRQFHNG